jgi:hypothetical protein
MIRKGPRSLEEQTGEYSRSHPSKFTLTFSVDAETDGLYGPVWAIGAVVLNYWGEVVARFEGQVSPASLTNTWVIENVVPHVNLPLYGSARELRDAFWAFWMTWREGVVTISDIGSPVESGLFRTCVEDDPEARQWNGPYPLHEVSTLLFAVGQDPDVDRLEYADMRSVSAMPGLQKHNPVFDAYVSALCWLKAEKLLAKRLK